MKRDNDDDCEVIHLTSFALNLFFWLFSSWETCKTVGANWFLVFLLGRRKNFVPILILSVHFQMITRYLGTQTHNIHHSTEFIKEWEKECTQSYVLWSFIPKRKVFYVCQCHHLKNHARKLGFHFRLFFSSMFVDNVVLDLTIFQDLQNHLCTTSIIEGTTSALYLSSSINFRLDSSSTCSTFINWWLIFYHPLLSSCPIIRPWLVPSCTSHARLICLNDDNYLTT